MVEITQERLLAGARNLKAKGYTPQQVDAWLQTKGSSLNAMKEFVKVQNMPMQPMTAEQKEQATQKAKEWREQVSPRTAGDKVADFMATNPYARQAGLVMQGVANADLNPAGYVARGFGMDTRPIEAQNGTERAAELIGKYGFDAAAVGSGLSGLASAGVGGTGLTGNVIKTMAEGGVPLALATSTGSALATGYLDPKTQIGRTLTDLGGGIATAPVMSVSKLASNMTGRIADSIKKIVNAEIKLNSLTNNPKKNIISTMYGETFGKGRNVNELLSEENERLARQAVKADKIKSARMENQATSQPSYDVRGVLGRNGRGSLKQDEIGAVRRWSPNETISKSLDNPITFNEYASNMENAKRFHKAMSDFKKNAGAKGAQVEQKPVEEYAKMRTFLSDDGKVGFAIKDDGDIVSVFSNKAPKGAGDSVIQAAVSAGGKKLDAFDTFLPEIYSKHGFKETERFHWDHKEAKNMPDWNKKEFKKFNFGEPDVVMMQYDPNYYGGYESPNSLENVVGRLRDIIKEGKSQFSDTWRFKNTDTRKLNMRKFIDSLSDYNKTKTMKRAGGSGADDIVKNATDLSYRFKLMKEGAPDPELQNILELPEMASARKTYSDFLNQYGDKTIPAEAINGYYNENPLAEPLLANAKAVNPTDYAGVKPNSLRELDKLKQILNRAQKSDDVIGHPKEGGYKNAENALKNLMEEYYAGFKDVNKQYAKANSAQNIRNRAIESNVNDLSKTQVKGFWDNGMINSLAGTGGIVGLMNPIAMKIAIGTLLGRYGTRKYFTDAGRELMYDYPQRELAKRLEQIIGKTASRMTAEDMAQYLQNM